MPEVDLYAPVKTFLEAQGYTVKGEIGPCDLITWNTPLRFMPPELAADNLDGFGGEMGIEIGFGRPVLVKYKETRVVG